LMNTSDQVTGPINVGNPNEFTILELAELVVELIGAKSKIEMKPLPHDDPQQRQPNIEMAKRELSWEPQTELKEGLQKTIAYFDGVLAQQQ